MLFGVSIARLMRDMDFQQVNADKARSGKNLVHRKNAAHILDGQVHVVLLRAGTTRQIFRIIMRR